jgi:Ca2+-binding RTX toxin-like protein
MHKLIRITEISAAREMADCDSILGHQDSTITGALPMATIWVDAVAATGGTGTENQPYATIQAAINVAGAGDTIAVRAGTYTENIRFNNGGSAGAPLKLVSVDGQGAACIQPADNALDTVDIAGADHIEITGFALVGGSDDTRQVVHIHGINDGTDFATDVVIADNLITRGAGDGIKGSKATGVTLTGNTITGGGASEAGIDFVGVDHARIEGNTIIDMAYVGIMLKGGSTDIVVMGNTISGAGHNAIEVGGYSNTDFYPPGFLEAGNQYEASNVLVSGNTISNSGNSALRLIGAQGVEIADNVFTGTHSVIKIDDSALYHSPWFSTDIGFSGNQITGDWLIDRSDHAQIYWDADVSQVLDIWWDATSANAPLPPSFTMIEGTSADDRLRGTGDDDQILGMNGKDQIEAAEGNDTLMGGAGDDTLRGEAGQDALHGDDGKDRLEGGDGDDLLAGGAGNDQLRGDDGNDWLCGDAGNDTLEGGKGNDTLVASAGNDTLKGNDGADEFVFAADTAFGSDRVDDFAHSDQDHIILSGFGAALNSFADLDSNQNGVLDSGDDYVSVSSGRSYIDLSAFYSHDAGSDVMRISQAGLVSADFLFNLA